MDTSYMDYLKEDQMELQFKPVNYVTGQDWDSFVKSVYNRPYKLAAHRCEHSTFIHTPNYGPVEGVDDVRKTVQGAFSHGCGLDMEEWKSHDVYDAMRHITEHLIRVKATIHLAESCYEGLIRPHLQHLANDMYEKGLIPAGDYVISQEG
jgi:hypothetical protein